MIEKKSPAGGTEGRFSKSLQDFGMQLLISKSSQNQHIYVHHEWPLGIFNRPPPSSDRRSLLISRRLDFLDDFGLFQPKTVLFSRINPSMSQPPVVWFVWAMFNGGNSPGFGAGIGEWHPNHAGCTGEAPTGGVPLMSRNPFWNHHHRPFGMFCQKP